MWNDISPIWARPQYDSLRLYPKDMMQVVGHTPVKVPELEGNLLSVDTFSTFSNNNPIGDQKFIWVDTVRKEWDYVN